jgi:hypothetical protein
VAAARASWEEAPCGYQNIKSHISGCSYQDSCCKAISHSRFFNSVEKSRSTDFHLPCPASTFVVLAQQLQATVTHIMACSSMDPFLKHEELQDLFDRHHETEPASFGRESIHFSF